MRPVLFNLGPLPISSFGLFLVIALFSALFISWRIARSYELDENKFIDISLLAFLGGLLGARLYFVALNWQIFQNISQIFLINRFPGLSFWGGLLGGLLALKLATKSSKFNFWQAVDFAAVGLMIAVVLGNIGCFLGGCYVGFPFDGPLSFQVVGVVGKRFPLALIESLWLFLIFRHLYKQALRFHFAGKIASVCLIWLGITKLTFSFLRSDLKPIAVGISDYQLWAAVSLLTGITVYYLRSRRSFNKDMKFLLAIPISSRERKMALGELRKSCYNHKVGFEIGIKKAVITFKLLPKIIQRRLNVKSTPTNYR